MIHLTAMESVCLATVLAAVVYAAACLRVLARHRRTSDGDTPQ